VATTVNGSAKPYRSAGGSGARSAIRNVVPCRATSAWKLAVVSCVENAPEAVAISARSPLAPGTYTAWTSAPVRALRAAPSSAYGLT
jgi:hypothetical protein